MGELPQARASLEEALRIAGACNHKHIDAHARIVLGLVLALGDASETAAAEQTILEGLKIAQDIQAKPLQAYGHLFLGETYTIAGHKQKALASLKKARQMCQEMGMDYFLATTEKALEKLDG